MGKRKKKKKKENSVRMKQTCSVEPGVLLLLPAMFPILDSKTESQAQLSHKSTVGELIKNLGKVFFFF